MQQKGLKTFILPKDENFQSKLSDLIVWSFSKTKKVEKKSKKQKQQKMAEKVFLSALLISSMKIQLSATWEEHLGFMKAFMKASWRLLFHEAAAQGKNRNKTRGNNNQHIELLSCMTDRHTENMCAGILTWGWSRRTCKNFAQGLVQEGGGKIANWVWSASFMLVSSCHKTNLMRNLDADHLHVTCVELYVIVHVPNGLLPWDSYAPPH